MINLFIWNLSVTLHHHLVHRLRLLHLIKTLRKQITLIDIWISTLSHNIDFGYY